MVATHTLMAFARSGGSTGVKGGIEILDALKQCYAGDNFGRHNAPLLPSDVKKIVADYHVYKEKGVIPVYVLRWLDHERVRQIQAHARVGPEGFGSFR